MLRTKPPDTGGVEETDDEDGFARSASHWIASQLYSGTMFMLALRENSGSKCARMVVHFLPAWTPTAPPRSLSNCALLVVGSLGEETGRGGGSILAEAVPKIHIAWLGMIFGILAAEFFEMFWLGNDQLLVRAVPNEKGIVTRNIAACQRDLRSTFCWLAKYLSRTPRRLDFLLYFPLFFPSLSVFFSVLHCQTPRSVTYPWENRKKRVFFFNILAFRPSVSVKGFRV